ncbi:MAG: TetR/AcrR family transcriptional regulator [Candidatus Limnocylindria bacterium]
MSRDRVLHAALRLADRRGIESLTMRNLARELGVEAMTLYYYVPNKDAVLEGIADLVASEIELPDPGPDWKTATRQRALSAHQVLIRHPWSSMLWMRVNIGPARMRYMDSALRGFREAGLSPAMTELAFHAVENHIVGYTLQEMSFTLPPEDLAEFADEFLRQLPTDEYPYLAEHVRQHMTHESIGGGDFEFGLELLLDGIERVRAQEDGRS